VVWVGAFKIFRDFAYRNPVQIFAQNRGFHGKCGSSGVGVIIGEVWLGRRWI
jgi:hypothetical protein